MRALFRSPSKRQERIRERFERFRDLLNRNSEVLNRIAFAMELLGGEYVFDRHYLESLAEDLNRSVGEVVLDLNAISGNRYLKLVEAADRIRTAIEEELAGRPAREEGELVLDLDDLETDLADVVGEKAARLAEVRRRLGAGVPPGFVVAAEAGRRLTEEARRAGADDLAAAIRVTPLPRELERAIERAVAALAKRAGGADRFAVRSSAVGEDGERSFAGQYQSVLNVPAEKVALFYREVVASLFAPPAIAYRARLGIEEPPEGMAVLVLPMVAAASAGVLYSFDPAAPAEETLVVAAAPGLGTAVVGGRAADRFAISRAPPHEVRTRAVVEKEEADVPAPRGGVIGRPLAAPRRAAPALEDGDLARLAATALTVERVLRFALDLEWAIDESGEIHVLQVRPLRRPRDAAPPRDIVEEARRNHRVLLDHEGEVGCRGIGSGPVVHVSGADSREDFPAGAVLVSRETSPLLSPCVARASAVVTDVGSAASHLGTVACEFQVPSILGAGDATKRLEPGTIVTVDAEEGVVYEGEVAELIRHQLLRAVPPHSSAEFRLLRRMLRRVAPLNLVDPSAREFTPSGCRTVHDLLRFAHEKAVAEISRGVEHGRKGDSHVKELVLPVPLDLVVVDVGGAIPPGSKGVRIRPEELSCRPLAPLIEGLTAPGVWETGPSALDFEGFFSSALRSQAVATAGGAAVTRNVAVVGPEYLNLNLKLGYHFNVLDCLLGDRAEKNYLTFFFVGGVTELDRRARRAEMLNRILTARGFRMETRGDLVVGQLSGVPAPDLVAELRVLGRLIGFTRQLDVLLRSEDAVDRCVRAFEAGAPAPWRERKEGEEP